MASVSRRTAEGCDALTEKEKQTLRLIVRGHDAKSTARELGLSVHTINERLRDARRKLAVSSSREAARLLLDTEGLGPDSAADKEIGDAKRPGASANNAPRPWRASRSAWLITGAMFMSAIVAILAVIAQPQIERIEGPAPVPGSGPATVSSHQAAVERAAREWLALVDAGNWQQSWRETGTSFRKLNTVDAWIRASEQARSPLGLAQARSLLTHDTMPAPPRGYDVVRFRTDFSAKPGAIETVTLERDGAKWKVVGYLIG